VLHVFFTPTEDMAVFTGGVNIGPYEAARHIAGVSARELSMVRNRHIDLKKLNAAIATVVNAFAELDVVKAWGDGTQVETYIDNLLAETSIRYGGVGGIAYHYISDTYVALFSRFIPCGVWEAVHLIEGLLANKSDIQPSTVHADTQGQSAPVFALATLFGFDLMPRIRNFKDLIFFRPNEHLVYPHTDALFGERGRNVIEASAPWRCSATSPTRSCERGSPPRPTRSSPTTGSPTGWRSATTASWPTTTRPSRRS